LRNVTEEEKENALKTLEAAATWFEAKLVEQYAVPKNSDPVLTTEEVGDGEDGIEWDRGWDRGWERGWERERMER
jgi:hypothetical protein